MHLGFRKTCIPLVLTLLAPFASAGVIVVDALGGGQFTQIQPAVDAALSGDTILVRAGTYTGFVIDGKSLVVTGDNITVVVTGTIGVRNIVAGQTVVLGHLSSTGPLSGSTDESQGTGLYVITSAGDVRCQDCVFTGSRGAGSGGCNGPRPGRHGVYLNTSARTAFVRCILQGGRGGLVGDTCFFSGGERGGWGIRSFISACAFYDCTIAGGDGGHGGAWGGNGAVSAEFSSPGLFASNSSFAGGDGGYALGEDVINPGQGGNGAGPVGSLAHAQFLDCVFSAGAAGALISGPGAPGVPGWSGSPSGANISYFAPPSCAVTLPSPVRENTSVPVSFQGRAGDKAYLIVSSVAQWSATPSWRGVKLALLSRLPPTLIDLGLIPPSGIVSTTIAIPDQGAGFSATTLHAQGFTTSPMLQTTLASFTELIVLDSIY